MLTIESYINSLPKDRKESVYKIIKAVEDNMPDTLTMPYEIKKKEEKHGTNTDKVQF